MASTAEASSRAVLDFVQSGAYPEHGHVASTTLEGAHLRALREELTKARAEAESDVKTISRDVAPDVDPWIQRAKQLQSDIERSRSIASDIVREAEEAKSMREEQQDAFNKVQLLRLEMQFNESLDQSLRLLQAAALSLAGAQQATTKSELLKALGQLNELDSILVQLQPFKGTNALDLVTQRSTALKNTLVKQTHEAWDGVIRVEIGKHELYIPSGPASDQSANSHGLQTVVELSSSLGILHTHVNSLSYSLQAGIMGPLFAHSERPDSKSFVVKVNHDRLSIEGIAEHQQSDAILASLTTIVLFLHNRLPSEVSSPLSEILMPPVISRLISHSLSDAIPTSLNNVGQYQALRDQVSAFSDTLNSIGWTGSTDLLEWNGQAPKNWLSKRRESSIGIIRIMLATGLTHTKTAERVETQMVSRGDVIGGGEGENDDWDDNWDENEPGNSQSTQKPEPSHETQQADEDEDTSAWDDGEDPESPQATHSHASDTNGKPKDADEEDDEAAAWGWDEQNSVSAPGSPVKSRTEPAKANGVTKTAPKTVEREVTLRETFTVTALPDELFETIAQLTRDAVALRGPEYASTPIAPAANGLYSVPTLVLAGFRALAPSRYELLPGGSMYLYNDSMRLAQQLTKLHESLVTSDPGASRMKMDADIAALESFARRAYGRAMASQRTILRDLVDNAQGFAQCTTAPYASECDNAVAATVGHIRAVAAEWAPILSHSALMQSLGSLLSAVVNKIVLDIEEMSDIGDDESKQLRRYCDDIAKLSDLFAAESPHAEGGEKADTTGIYVAGWFRFQYLSEILESSLADIRYLWNEGELRLEFDAEEVVELIRALFKDSELRRRAIGEIRRG